MKESMKANFCRPQVGAASVGKVPDGMVQDFSHKPTILYKKYKYDEAVL